MSESNAALAAYRGIKLTRDGVEAILSDAQQHAVGAAIGDTIRLCGMVLYFQSSAKLVAAAPDLIDALELIAGLHNHEKPSFELAQAMYEAACIARSAIHKATA